MYVGSASDGTYCRADGLKNTVNITTTRQLDDWLEKVLLPNTTILERARILEL